MQITMNGEPLDLAGPTTVGDLLVHEELRGVAVAVNGCVVPRHRHGAYPVSDGDRVEMVTAVQGG